MTAPPKPPPGTESRSTARLGRALVQKIFVALKNARLYEEDNVLMREAAEEVAAAARSILETERLCRLSHLFDSLSLNDQRLRFDVAGANTFRSVTEAMGRLDIGEVCFLETLTASEVTAFCRVMNRHLDEGNATFARFMLDLREAGVRGVALEERHDRPQKTNEAMARDVKERSVRGYFKSIEAARKVLTAPDPTRIDFRRAKRVVQNMVDTINQEDFVLLALASIKNYDEYTFNHSANVAIYSIALGQRLGLDRHALADLGMSGLFHDLGKTRVPKEILNKSTVLDREEWETMKSHPVRGAEILLQSRKISDGVIRNILVAFEHHLNVDLGGYPPLTDRRDLSLFSKIVAIADCYDALTTPRVYRSACYTPQEALSIMMEARGQVFDPAILKVFVNYIGIYPVGSIVQLTSGEMGVVCRPGANTGDIDRPFVKVVADLLGNRVPERIEDLSSVDETGQAKNGIVRTVEPGEFFPSIGDYLEAL